MFYAYLESIKSRLNGRTSVHHDTRRQLWIANRVFLKSFSALLSSLFSISLLQITRFLSNDVTLCIKETSPHSMQIGVNATHYHHI